MKTVHKSMSQGTLLYGYRAMSLCDAHVLAVSSVAESAAVYAVLTLSSDALILEAFNNISLRNGVVDKLFSCIYDTMAYRPVAR
jgi:hypothetical protein